MAAASSLIRRPWTVDDVRAFAPSVAANPWGPLEDAQDVLTGAHLFELRGVRDAHALIAVRPVQCALGRRLDVVGLVSDAGRLTVEDIRAASLSMAQAMACDMLAMTTLRPHLARACVRAGWAETGALLTMDARNIQ